MNKGRFLKELDPKVKTNIKNSIYDASASAGALGLAETYFPAFGLFLHATSLQIGILTALPAFFSAFTQLFSLKALNFVPSRKFLIVTGTQLQAIILIPILLLPFFFKDSTDAIPLLICLIMLHQGALGFTVPIWNSLIGDLIPAHIRGRYFGLRNQMSGITSFIGMLLAGATLSYFSKLEQTVWGFFIIFLLAVACRIISAKYVSKYEDPIHEINESAYFSLWQFITRVRYANFTKFVIFAAIIQGGAAFSAPYFTVYMLRDLKMPYMEYTFAIATPTVVQVFALQIWGMLVDRFGSKKILTLCSFGVGINPLLWLFSSNIGFIIFVQIFSGLVWSGFNLGVSTFLFDAVTPPKRARCAAYQSLVQGSFVLLGSLLGGYTSQHLPLEYNFYLFTWTPISPLLIIFAISGIIRLMTAIVFRKLFKEVRDVEKTRAIKLLFYFFPFKETFNPILTGFSKSKRHEENSDE
ncbi:MAG: MFS transporter [Proteobacteria bacterium]|nr:MFS transporter [Pseudomonadota bacterium]